MTHWQELAVWFVFAAIVRGVPFGLIAGLAIVLWDCAPAGCR